MEMATVQPEESQFDGQAEATRSTVELFQWSDYVHVGRGADTCEHAEDGTCVDAEHFHAWLCLPNPFQVRDIADKARAAKARKVRALRDATSDAHEILELELEELRIDHYDMLVTAIARAEVEKRMGEIVRGVIDGDERFEHHPQDFEELQRLRDLSDPSDQEKQETEQLEADMLAYGEAMQSVIEAETEKETERLKGMPPDDVVEIERRARIEEVGTEIYLHTYYTWCMYIGTRVVGTPHFTSRRRFGEPDALKNAPPEVVVALREKIRELEQKTIARSDASGNS
jgi:hypothetical protein